MATTQNTGADKATGKVDQPAPDAPATDAPADATADATSDAARVAELEAEIARLREQVDAQAARIAEPSLPEGYVYVVDGAGQPIPSNPFVPKEWLTKGHEHLLPEGAKKATAEQEAAVKATLPRVRTA